MSIAEDSELHLELNKVLELTPIHASIVLHYAAFEAIHFDLEFRRFTLPFWLIPDEYVSPRYHFGQLRLTRLNYAVHLLRASTMGGAMYAYYHRRNWQIGVYLRLFGAPQLFFFAAFSVVLSAMQVILAALGQDNWAPFVRVSWGISVAVIIVIVGLAISSLLGVFGLLAAQAQFALRMRGKERITKTRMPSV